MQQGEYKKNCTRQVGKQMRIKKETNIIKQQNDRKYYFNNNSMLMVSILQSKDIYWKISPNHLVYKKCTSLTQTDTDLK
jgi:hypothetical protein